MKPGPRVHRSPQRAAEVAILFCMSRFIQVAVPLPLRHPLSYRVPDGWPVPRVGSRVLVPVGPRAVTGCVVENNVRSVPVDEDAIKDILKQVDDEALVSPTVMKLALWAADYYLCGPGQTLEAAGPPGGQSGFRMVRHFEITSVGRAFLAERTLGGASKRTGTIGPRQRLALETLVDTKVGLGQPLLVKRGVPAATLNRLIARGFVRGEHRRVMRHPSEEGGTEHQSSRILTSEQSVVLAGLSATLSNKGFHVALLHGVTGSGKTEIYLRLAVEAQRLGLRVLVLVPEIGLTPAMVRVFRPVFGTRLAIQHSGLSAGERHDQWHQTRAGEVDVVVGTRSAIFAPLENVGLIVVDEEHDASYKQEEIPRYHGRDVAIMRAKQAGALVVLGSATPSLESYSQATRGRYELITLSKRITGQPLPTVKIVDMREEYRERGHEIVLSRLLVTGIERRICKGEQVIVLLNRRGFASAVFCRECASTANCPNCSVSLTVHQVKRRMQCHYCGYWRSLSAHCVLCQGEYVELTGIGTERIEREVRRSCPEARVARMDRDTVARRGAVSALLARFGRLEIDVLVGTQMIAKGHDFPQVTLVGVVSADIGLGIADFRASERTFQLLTQVAGRSGRGKEPGEAIVQTLYPDHYSIYHASHQDYQGFYRDEIAFRKAMRYPPSLALVNLIIRGRTLGAAMRDGALLAEQLRRHAQDEWVLGPAPAALGRLKGEHRVQVLAKGTHRGRLREMVDSALGALPRLGRLITVDIDPVSVR